jgi:hypothetical protein
VDAIAAIHELRAGSMSLRRIAEEVGARHAIPLSHMAAQAVVRPRCAVFS